MLTSFSHRSKKYISLYIYKYILLYKLVQIAQFVQAYIFFAPVTETCNHLESHNAEKLNIA